jgi:RNA polymerase sigma factor (sigma-70 family)
LQLTGKDRQRAEDLLHDAFVQFSLSLTDLEAIQHMDAYLYGMLRNIYLAQTRRSIRIQNRSISIVDYDSAETGLKAIDPRDQIQLQDELRQICHYGCVRKESSKAGSVLVLRFFHGYYPGEIAKVLRTTRHAVEDWLRIARREIRLYLNDSNCLKFMKSTPAAEMPPTGFARGIDEFLRELRFNIFGARKGDCLTTDALAELYQSGDAPSVDSATLGHIVSCPNCLDEANRLLDLPLLAERYPTDMLGADTRGGKGGSNTPGGGGSSGGGNVTAMREAVKRHRRGVKKVFEHRPQELCVTVNGYPLGSQRIGLELNELTLSVKGEDKIKFVEIVSEQETRLLLLNVDEPPPSGLYEQSEHVALSDGRMLEARLSFSNPWPTLHIIYRDPTLKAETAISVEDFDEEAFPSTPPTGEENPSGLTSDWPLKRFASQLWRDLADWRFWIRPGSITAIFAILVIVAMLLMQMRTPPARVSPVELLQQSTMTEEAISLTKDYILHRTIALVERRGMRGELVAQRRIEVWHSAEKGITARRLYGEQNQLIAGEWIKADGSRTLYQHGTQSRLAPKNYPDNIRGFDDAWLLSLSAQDFTRLIGHADKAQVEVRPDSYVINYQSMPGDNQGQLVEAALVLHKSDLHAIEQTVTVRQDGALRQYSFIETSLEKRPKDEVAAEVFEPEPELLGPISRGTDLKSKQVQAVKESIESGEPQLRTTTTVTASPELEVEVTFLLDQIKANLGEQVDLQRTQAGTLRVQAITETEQRKAEILHALSPVASNSAVEVQVETIAEALKRQTQLPSSAITVREIEVEENPFPAYAELSRYFSDIKGLSDEKSGASARRFASGILSRSRQAMSHAWALKQLARRFSSEELNQLNPEARARWFAMIRAHAQAFQQETVGLRQELEPIFFRSATGSDVRDETALGSATELRRAAEQLFELGSTQERAIRFAFTTSPGAATSSVINGQQLWQSLRSAEILSAKIRSALPQ